MRIQIRKGMEALLGCVLYILLTLFLYYMLCTPESSRHVSVAGGGKRRSRRQDEYVLLDNNVLYILTLRYN